jgi:hypothetical protein
MKYWVYMNGEVPGSYAPAELSAMPGFAMTTLVCPAEGEILEKNWRRAGEFEEIIKVLHERDAAHPPASPAPPEAFFTGDVNVLIDTASSRLFSHVSELMKELENRREERALTFSLQKQLVALKDELSQLRDKNAALEERLPRVGELEESLAKEQARTQKLDEALKAREEGMADLRQQLSKAREEFELAKRRLGEANNDLSIRNRLVDKLSRDLTDKELSLAKALGVIRRLEEDLNRLLPVASAGAVPLERPAGEQNLPSASTSEPAAQDAPPPNQPAAQGALVNLLKKFTGKLDQ